MFFVKAQRQVTADKAKTLASETGMQYFECSAKTGKGVTEPFLLLAREVKKKEEEEERKKGENRRRAF